MLKAKEILRLKHEVGLSLREIGNACNCGKSTVSEILERAVKAGITWPATMSDKQLLSLLYPPVIAKCKKAVPEPDMENVFHELKKRIADMSAFLKEQPPPLSNTTGNLYGG